MTTICTRNRLVQYLSYDGPARAPLRSLLGAFAAELSETAIFGGMIRDFGLGYARSFRSDIDIVTMSSAKEILRFIKPFDPIRNKFGGYRFFATGRLFDIWSFQDTWAIREGIVKGENLEDLCKTTFFSIDAAIFKLRNYNLVAPEDYGNKLAQRILEINLVDHPHPEKIARRAIRMAIGKDLKIAPELCEFIVRHIESTKENTFDDQVVERLHRHLRSFPGECFRYEDQLQIWPQGGIYPQMRRVRGA